MHPLLQRNTSDVTGPRFSSRFSGEEFFLADHVIQGRRVMPAVAYLEMARAGLAQAGGAEHAWQLRDVSWSRPLALREGTSAELHLALFPEADGTIGIEIYSEADGETVLHSAATGVPGAPAAAQYCDLAGARAACGVAELSAAQCYAMLGELGLEYGAAQRALAAVYVGEGQVLARLELPAAQAAQAHRYLLHPSLLDAALQAPIGLSLGVADAKAPLPFGLERIDILGECSTSMWALVRTSAGAQPGERVRRLDIDLCDPDGKLCVRLVGFASRGLSADFGAAHAEDHTVLLEPEWQPSEVAPDAEQPVYVQHVVMICDMAGIAGQEVVGPTGARCIQIASHHNGMVDDFQRYAVAAFEEIKWILQSRPVGKVLFQIVVPALSGHQLMAGLSGLLKTAHLENPHLIGQLIALDNAQQGDGLREKLLANRRMPQDRHIRYEDDGRWVAGWKEVTAGARAMHKPWKAGGVYLITGGAGGLGLIFAREIAQQAAASTLVLTGRSAPGEASQRQVRALEALGARAQYVQTDVADKAAVSALVDGIVRDYGTLDGIIHSAGIMRDNFILKKTTRELQAVLAPKTLGLLHLDEASKKLKLDFLICFSSLAGAYGNAGQADYATANAFMDAYAVYRNSLVALEQRHGRTVSINWPLWQDGGMRMDQQAEQLLAQGSGMLAMASADGVAALYRVLATGQDHMVVMQGHAAQMRHSWQAPAAPVAAAFAAAAVVAAPMASADLLAGRAAQYFTKLLSGVIKLSAERIDVAAPLDKYGIDSIMAMGLVSQLEKVFGALSKTLVFEHHTTQNLIDYFIQAYPQRLQEVLGLNAPAPVPPSAAPPAATATATAPEPAPAATPRRGRYAGAAPAARRDSVQEAGKDVGKDIAIVGLAGRYPQADNVQAFWDNLKNGKDSITEIPPERWDHGLYFDPDRDKPGMTYSKWGGFIDGVDEFDPMFFNMPPLHAEFTDPQERLFLQCAYATLEDAGYTRETLARQAQGNVGVFVGVMYEEYQLFGAEAHARGRHVAVSSNPSSVANRVSYFCNFNGPSMAINTMCSSSLTAIHLACQSLQEGDCELALAGGVNVSVHPNKYLMLGQGKFVSSSGQCESFGQGGDGYVPAEGVGAVLLKPLAKAIADGDHIYGVIKGSALNHGGKTNGYTVPNPGAQSKVVARALRRAGVDARDISYLEAHGTGTSLGDPIEIAGLSRAFREQTQDRQFCAIGSVKSNIGHCESAAGIAALTKVLMQMRHGQLAPSLHSAVLNPHIDFAASPFVVQQELAEWKRPVSMRDGVRREGARIAGISSFGAGGSNAHLVIQEHVATAAGGAARGGPALVVLSARTVQALQAQARQLADVLDRHGWTDADLADIAYTLQTGREAMEERLAMQADSLQSLRNQLGDWLGGVDGSEEVYRGQVRGEKSVVGLFAADEDMGGIVDAWIAKGKYGKLLSLWVRGFGFDWHKLYGAAAPRRISLPTYPFAKERYWVPAAPAAGVDALA
ncbi:SDR family NAD(P)-dependent oxidoreductase, partial [Janthinobacterium sp. CG3]|uniref:SDR family NAD(P)-dependent oxidoreductase n=1 Tax=Janthinobacterium sp. CG3 TaxID=1075768 RepID=UPI0018DEDEA5